MLLAYLLAGLGGGPALQPTGKWVVEFADSSCVAFRAYGTVDDPLNFHMKAPMLGERHEIVIAVSQSKGPKSIGFERGWIERSDGSRAMEITAGTYVTVTKMHVSRFTIDPEKYVIGQDGDRFIVQLEKRRYDLALPNLKEALQVLDRCLVDLRKEFGVGDDVTRQIATEAKLKESIGRYFRYTDYPLEAVMKGEQGWVGALFWVETNGRVTDCQIIESSKRKSLDERTCEVIKNRSRFTPALDHQGNSIRSPQYQRVRWSMPE